MFRQILGYMPATVVPAAISFIMIYAYTRLLTPSDYGDFSLAFSAILVVQTSLFFAIPMALARYYPEALAHGRAQNFLTECYAVFYALSALVMALIAAASVFSTAHSSVPWGLAVLVLVARSAVVLNQSVNRMTTQMRRYNVIECAHAVLGFGLGLMFIFFGLGGMAEAVMLGLLVAATLCLLADHKLLLLPFRQNREQLNRGAIARLVRFAMPLIVMDSIVCVLALSDRFLLEAFGGAGALGIYTVAYNLVERPTTLICTAVTTATYPMSVQALQRQGRAAGGRQVGRNAAILLAMVLPACVGLALTAPYLAAVMVGPQFRLGVAALIPVMCVAALLRGLSMHVCDHAFHLAGRPTLALLVYVPAALANVALNLTLIPRYGMFGAAWTALACQAVAVVGGFWLGRRAFPIQWPLHESIKIVFAVLPMGVALSLLTFPLSGGGLFLAVALGILLFSLSALLLDVGGARLAMLKLTRVIGTADAV